MGGRGAAARLHLFGIRHHGPGSAHSLLAALNALDPSVLLIEGPPEADDLIRFATSPSMVPPVALLVHGQDDPGLASFYPFGAFSPEWQGMRWAIARRRPVRFIDLPVANRLALRGGEREAEDLENDPGIPEQTEQAAILRDPLAYLAAIAGYDDSETWWNALIEQSANAPTIFAAIETAMTALRAHVDALPARERRIEDQREAHMRLAIGAALGGTEGAVAVVCGAWHVPALRRSVSIADDKALLKGLPKIKVAATWVPWTHTRLAAASGYGAGIRSPGWYDYLWRALDRADPAAGLSPRRFTIRWQTQVAGLLRQSGRQTSTASVIDAVQLAEALAALRDLALPGLDEMREASLATLCLGETAPWQLIEAELVIGGAVGEIADDVPQMPLQADLARQQKSLKLKPEALDRELSLDLRTDAGLAKSLLLHRLNLIDVPWGEMLQAGSSRGTFRENWQMRWEPEYSVRLAEALIYGTTVEQAACNAAVAAARKAGSVKEIAAAVKACLLAGLDTAARETIGILQAAAAVTSDVASLAGAIPPLVTVLRYGTAREMPEAELRLLVTSLTEAVCAGLVHACRNLQTDEAESLRAALAELTRHLPLLDEEHLSEDWSATLRRLADDADSHAMLRGFAVRALHDQGTIEVAMTGAYLSRALSRAVPPAEASHWLDGFLGDEGHVLLHDTALTGRIDSWVAELGEEDFTALLPTLRRAFSAIDRLERRRLLDLLRRPTPVLATGGDGAPAVEPFFPGFAAALPLLLTILGLDKGEA